MVAEDVVWEAGEAVINPLVGDNVLGPELDVAALVSVAGGTGGHNVSGHQHLTNGKRALHRSIDTDQSEDSNYLAAGDAGETVPALLDNLLADNPAYVEAEDSEGLVLAEPVLVKQLDVPRSSTQVRDCS